MGLEKAPKSRAAMHYMRLAPRAGCGGRRRPKFRGKILEKWRAGECGIFAPENAFLRSLFPGPRAAPPAAPRPAPRPPIYLVLPRRFRPRNPPARPGGPGRPRFSPRFSPRKSPENPARPGPPGRPKIIAGPAQHQPPLRCDSGSSLCLQAAMDVAIFLGCESSPCVRSHVRGWAHATFSGRG